MMTSKKLPLLIFDLDGTLIDSALDLQISMNVMLKRYGHHSVDLPTLISHIGDGLQKLVNDFFPQFQLESKENLEKVDEFLEVYERNMTQHTVLYPGVLDFLQNYKGPKALVTNKAIHPTLKIFKHFKLDQLNWVDLIGGDSLAEKKPSPLPLLHVMSKAGYDKTETWMIGDGRPDMKSAMAAGCTRIAVHYGYSKPEELSPYSPHHVLETFSDLNRLINS
jgi:phosphoglycolate phosphatase